MRVSNVCIRNHPGFGSLDVSFCGSSGKASRTVVIAGENGCGKTAVLEAIFYALAPLSLYGSSNKTVIDAECTIKVEADVKFKGVCDLTQEENVIFSPTDHILQIEYNGTRLRENLMERTCGWLVNGNVPAKIGFDNKDWFGRDNACFLSEANVTFVIPQIGTARTLTEAYAAQNMTVEQRYPLKSGPNLGGEIAQLFVDLFSEDRADLYRWVTANPGVAPPEAAIGKRIKSFSEAFSRMFPSKRLVDVVPDNGEFRVIFEEGGRKTSLADLSTGEKQIVFRGAFLLRCLTDLPGSIILVDEPELSLHPKWQGRIIDFYDAIAPEENGMEGQIIVTGAKSRG